MKIKILIQKPNLFGYSVNYVLSSKRKAKIVIVGMCFESCFNLLFFNKFEYFCEQPFGLGMVHKKRFPVWCID